MKMSIGVLGAGGFGRALALAASRNGHAVSLWSRQQRDLPAPIRTTNEIDALRDCELIFVAVPARHAVPVAEQLGEVIDGRHLVAHISRGLVGAELRTLTQIIRDKTACRRVGVLAGPLVADALAEGRPSGAILGTAFPEVTSMVRDAIGSAGLRIYETVDVVGVELASATVGFLTVVIGYAQEMGAEPGTLAVLATRGMVEMSRVGQTLGAVDETFMGLAGLGDLIAAVAGDERPELRLGRALARGADLRTAIGELGAYVEGFEVATHLLEHARAHGLETPISSTFAAVSSGRMSPDDAIQALMLRRVGKE
jgi:glycerol-3-phosphate dehydrogenase (NAD(P)+)